MMECFRQKIKDFFIIGSTLFIFVQMVPVAFADGIILDHTCTDLSQIPVHWLEQAKNLTLHYAHTSHGSQVTSGILNLESQDPNCNVAIRTSSSAGLPPVENPLALRIYDGNPPETYIEPADYWDGEPGRDRTRAVVNTGDYNFSMWSWCGQVSDASESYMQNYLDTMAQFEVEYPNMRFIYMTGHLDGTGSGGNLHIRNEQIRAYCNANDKVLFDFADIERYNPDGTDYLDLGANDNCDYTGGNWASEWCAANPGSDLCDSCSCAHSQALNCNLKARAFWWMMERLAGWNPDGGPVANFSGTPTNGAAPLEVSFTDISTGEITGWSWDFDNNGTEDSTNQNPTYTYNNSGTYSVALEVTGSGGTDTETKTNYITVTTPIQYDLTLNSVGSGSVTLDPPGGIYNAGTEVKLTPVPAAGWAFNGWSGDLSGFSNPVTIVMNSDKTITATFDVDNDTDGISDDEEDAGPNGGDGNDDNQQDSGQPNVATFHTQDGTNYVTLESPAGTTLATCRAVSTPNEPGAPSGVNFPYGFIDFTINNVGVGGATTLILYLPSGTSINTYWKYGPTPTNAIPHWYEFMYESSTQTGAEITGNEITLHFIDGINGDDDISANGAIIDQGGPGTYSSSSGSSSDGGSSGGSCFIKTAYGR